MADGSGVPARSPMSDLAAYGAEMRKVYPDYGLRRSAAAREVRAQNQARFEASLRTRQRPTRVS